jgi:C1A family cysteine protease
MYPDVFFVCLAKMITSLLRHEQQSIFSIAERARVFSTKISYKLARIYRKLISFISSLPKCQTMKQYIALLVLVLCGLAQAEHTEEEIDDIFTQFREENNKHLGDGYSDMTAFLQARENIKRHLQKTEENKQDFESGKVTWERRYITRFFDRTSADVRLELCRAFPPPSATKPLVGATISDMTKYPKAPASLDWSVGQKLQLMSPVRDQLNCGSCWAFSTVSQVEARVRFRTQAAYNTVLSPQQLVDCNRGYNEGCNGGWPKLALDFLVANGTQTEALYPYKAVQKTCKTRVKPVTAPISSAVEFFTNKNETLMMNILAAEGPVVALIYASNDFVAYGGGIFSDQSCKLQPNCVNGVNHAIVVVGYGYDSVLKKNYWKIL